MISKNFPTSLFPDSPRAGHVQRPSCVVCGPFQSRAKLHLFAFLITVFTLPMTAPIALAQSSVDPNPSVVRPSSPSSTLPTTEAATNMTKPNAPVTPPGTDPWPGANEAPAAPVASEPPSPNLPADAVARATARAQARWAAIVANDYETAFGFYSAASRRGFTVAELKSHWSAFAPKAARVQEVRCSGEVCSVALFIDASIRLPRVGLTQQFIPANEKWAWDGTSFSLLKN